MSYIEYLHNELQTAQDVLKKVSDPRMREAIKNHIEMIRASIKALERSEISDQRDGIEEPCEIQATSMDELEKFFK